MSCAISSSLPLSQPLELPPLPQKESYLHRCVQELDPKTIARLDRKANLWEMAKVALIINAVAATAIYIALMIATLAAPLLLPLYALPLATLYTVPSIFLGLMAKKCSTYAHENRTEAQHLRGIRQEYDALTHTRPEEIQNQLQQAGIWEMLPHANRAPNALLALKPFLARFHYWNGQLPAQEAKCRVLDTQLHRNKHSNIARAIFGGGVKNLNQVYLDPKLLDQVTSAYLQWLSAKMHTAFALFLLRHPRFCGKPQEIYQISPTPYYLSGNSTKTFACLPRCQNKFKLSASAVANATPLQLSCFLDTSPAPLRV